jgi:hypothetical protein
MRWTLDANRRRRRAGEDRFFFSFEPPEERVLGGEQEKKNVCLSRQIKIESRFEGVGKGGAYSKQKQ